MRGSPSFWTLLVLASVPLFACEREREVKKPSFAIEGPHSVVLVSYDPERKIQAIRAYRQETGKGLAEAKRAIEGLTEKSLVLEIGMAREAAEALQERLASGGLEAEIWTMEESASGQEPTSDG